MPSTLVITIFIILFIKNTFIYYIVVIHMEQFHNSHIFFISVFPFVGFVQIGQFEQFGKIFLTSYLRTMHGSLNIKQHWSFSVREGLVSV